MTTLHAVEVTFEMANGKTLKVAYHYSYWGGNYWNPPEIDVQDDGEITIEDEPIDFKDLPKGLDKVVEEMYEADSRTKKFGYTDEICESEDFTEPYDD